MRCGADSDTALLLRVGGSASGPPSVAAALARAPDTRLPLSAGNGRERRLRTPLAGNDVPKHESRAAGDPVSLDLR
jgi:hypothetical protein